MIYAKGKIMKKSLSYKYETYPTELFGKGVI